MKKVRLSILCALLALVMCVMLVGCGDKKDETASNENNVQATVDPNANGGNNAANNEGNITNNGDNANQGSNTNDAPAMTDEQLIVGNWQSTIDFTEIMGLSASDVPAGMSLTCTMTMSFAADGTCTAGIDENSIDELIKNMLEITAQQMGMTMDEFLEAAGMSMEDALATTKSEMGETTLTQTGIWKLENGKLYITYEGQTFTEDDANEITISQNSLTIKDLEEYGDLVFSRVG